MTERRHIPIGSDVELDAEIDSHAGEGTLPSPTDEADVLTVVEGAWAGAAPDGGSQSLFVAKTTISAADFATLETVPVEIAPAPGSGKAIALVEITAAVVFGTSPYTSGFGMLVAPAGSADQSCDLYFLADSLMTATEDKFLFPQTRSASPDPYLLVRAKVDDAPLVIYADSQTDTDGDSTLVVSCIYAIVDLG